MITENIKTIINDIASQFPLIDKSDLSILAKIKDKIDIGKEIPGLPAAFVTLLNRTSKLISNVIMEETDFTKGCKRLGESISKMLAYAGQIEIPDQPASLAATLTQDTITNGTEKVPDDMKELVVKFSTNQMSILEDFEAYILEMEKGIPQAHSAIKRILHTWKGEFGVLNLQSYAQLIHEIEERLELRSMGSDSLLRVKDFLQNRIRQFAQGSYPTLSATDYKTLFGEAENTVFSTEEQHQNSSVITPAESKVAVSEIAQQSLSGDASMMGDFVHESRDHLHQAEVLLLELELDPHNNENINSIFRSWHTVKGVAGFLGLREINSFAHKMESLMDRVRKREMNLEAAHIDLLIQANDCLKELINGVQRMVEGEEVTLPQSYASLNERLLMPTTCAPEAIHPVVPPELRLGEILVERGAVSSQAIKHALDLQQQGNKRKLGEILIDENLASASAIASALAGQSAARQSKSIDETIRVPIGRIDQLIDSIGEAVIAQSMIYAHQLITALDDQSLHTKISHGAIIMRQIQEMAMSLRMVSVKSTFQKMARLARDLGKKFNRDIDFITEGEDTELDKSVVENIGDPLMHMIRNSIDHGIESHEERIAAGKSARATIKLKAYHRAGSIYIEISDDGRGLDKEAIFEKAISRGLCSDDVRLTDQEIYQFIFMPGFSTAKQVTDVSGRGVGMDVVRRNIELLRGSVEIDSAWGKGTTFTIRLPLTLAIVDGMVVRAGSELYIIPTLAIVESIKPSKSQIDTVLNQNKIIKVRGELIPMTHLSLLFNVHDDSFLDVQSGVVMIVEDMMGKKLGLHVDEIIGQQQVVIKSLGIGIGEIPGVTGGAIMNDGRVSLILDISGIIKMGCGVETGEKMDARSFDEKVIIGANKETIAAM